MSQFCYEVVIVSDNGLPAQWRARSIITLMDIIVAFSFVALWLAKQLFCTTSATVCLIDGATLNLTDLTEVKSNRVLLLGP